eukprot:TRINITY_DN29935_c0_g1_i1.p1 TRINITY_DN29935_c0_g1~~TRINITY_DN29935_c0_g1_i1.p1  ORF type:complete len:999 (+),score=215.70 TRINITY_DN29935_c0_g1_i1:69-2999(+)
MGPRGLWAELRRRGAARQLEGAELERELEGKTVAVDAAVWVYEAQTQPEVLNAFGPERAVLKVAFERCVRWLRKGVLPVLVLEGSGGGRSQRSCTLGHGGLGAAFAAQPKLRALLKALGVPWVDSAGEAEATCAALAEAGRCDYVATTDFDALLFGAPKVLRDLDLQGNSRHSRCELWDIKRIEALTGLDRKALVAAAFLIGCDYDCRGGEVGGLSQKATSQDSEGVRGVAARQAVAIARGLRLQQGEGAAEGAAGDALAALGDVLAGRRSAEGILAAGSCKASKAQATRCNRTLARAASDASCMDGLAAAVRQYGRLGGLTMPPLPQPSHLSQASSETEKSSRRGLSRNLGRAFSAPECPTPASRRAASETGQQLAKLGSAFATPALESPAPGVKFSWRGIDEAAAAALLSGIYGSGKEDAKLGPLQLEWALRVTAAECPTQAKPVAQLRYRWALERSDIRYVPLSAVRKGPAPSESSSQQPSQQGACVPSLPYALVKFAEVSAASLAVPENAKLPADWRHARLALAEACGLFSQDTAKPSGGRRPKELATALDRMLSECSEDTRSNPARLRSWAIANGLPLIPSSGQLVQRSGKVRVFWSEAEADEAPASQLPGPAASTKTRPAATIFISAETAKAFGGELAAVAAGRGGGQRRLSEALRVGASRRSSRSKRRQTMFQRRLTKSLRESHVRGLSSGSSDGSSRSGSECRGSESGKGSDGESTAAARKEGSTTAFSSDKIVQRTARDTTKANIARFFEGSRGASKSSSSSATPPERCAATSTSADLPAVVDLRSPTPEREARPELMVAQPAAVQPAGKEPATPRRGPRRKWAFLSQETPVEKPAKQPRLLLSGETAEAAAAPELAAPAEPVKAANRALASSQLLADCSRAAAVVTQDEPPRRSFKRLRPWPADAQDDVPARREVLSSKSLTCTHAGEIVAVGSDLADTSDEEDNLPLTALMAKHSSYQGLCAVVG